MKELTSMKLHDELTPDTEENIKIIRVPGGWIYIMYAEMVSGDFRESAVFVPFTLQL